MSTTSRFVLGVYPDECPDHELTEEDPRAARELLPAAATFVLRGDLLDVHELTETARRNHDVYGFYGISVFATVAPFDWTTIASTRLSRAQWLAEFRVGDLLNAELELWDTGQAPHYDVVHHEPDRAGRQVRRVSAPAGAQPALRATGRRGMMAEIDLHADLNAEDDDGRGWTTLSDAADPDGVHRGAILRAGSPQFWSWVRIDAVDIDGQVHFTQISAAEAARRTSAAAQ